ncbi:MAG: hypothetical protein ABL971_00160 [Vicinamibacterales bacterium]
MAYGLLPYHVDQEGASRTMQNLGTTNVILAVIAVIAVVQFLLILAGAFWASRRVSRLMDDLHLIAARTERAGLEVERAAKGAQEILNMVGFEVDRATKGVRVAMDLVEGVYHQASAIGAGLRAGLQELASRKRDQDPEPDPPRGATP